MPRKKTVSFGLEDGQREEIDKLLEQGGNPDMDLSKWLRAAVREKLQRDSSPRTLAEDSPVYPKPKEDS